MRFSVAILVMGVGAAIFLVCVQGLVELIRTVV